MIFTFAINCNVGNRCFEVQRPNVLSINEILNYTSQTNSVNFELISNQEMLISQLFYELEGVRKDSTFGITFRNSRFLCSLVCLLLYFFTAWPFERSNFMNDAGWFNLGFSFYSR